MAILRHACISVILGYFISSVLYVLIALGLNNDIEVNLIDHISRCLIILLYSFIISISFGGFQGILTIFLLDKYTNTKLYQYIIYPLSLVTFLWLSIILFIILFMQGDMGAIVITGNLCGFYGVITGLLATFLKLKYFENSK